MPRYRSSQADEGLLLMIIGLAIGSPTLYFIGAFEYATAPVYYYGIAATATTAGTTFLGLSAFALGALVIYGSIGLAYLASAAKESFKNDDSVWDMLKSRVTHNDHSTVKGVINTVAAVLWSPFLAIGGLVGKGTKAVVNVFSSSSHDKRSAYQSQSDFVDMDGNGNPMAPLAAPSVDTTLRADNTHEADEEKASSPPASYAASARRSASVATRRAAFHQQPPRIDAADSALDDAVPSHSNR